MIILLLFKILKLIWFKFAVKCLCCCLKIITIFFRLFRECAFQLFFSLISISVSICIYSWWVQTIMILISLTLTYLILLIDKLNVKNCFKVQKSRATIVFSLERTSPPAKWSLYLHQTHDDLEIPSAISRKVD